MPASFDDFVRAAFPNLALGNYRITSAPSWDYNCIAWALGITDAWWWPTPGRFWPPGVEREETVPAFLSAFGTRGFSPCSPSALESGLEKIALYAIGGVPTHAARQVGNGWWTSKLGPSFDIEHASVEALAGGAYGHPVAFLSRPGPETTSTERPPPSP